MREFIDELRQILIGNHLDLLVNVIEINQQQRRLWLENWLADLFLRRQHIAELLEHLIGDTKKKIQKFIQCCHSNDDDDSPQVIVTVTYHLMHAHIPDLSFCSGMSHR